MSEERKKVLELLAAGKINVADAERLISALSTDTPTATAATAATGCCDGSDSGCCGGEADGECCNGEADGECCDGKAGGDCCADTNSAAAPAMAVALAGAAGNVSAKAPTFLCVRVNDGGDKVNVRVPIALLRAGMKLGALLPADAQKKLADQGIKLDTKNIDELLQHLNDLNVNVAGKKGETVTVCCE